MANAGIAAIIPVFNRPAVVVDAMQSVAEQTRPPIALVVVDDGSTDETRDAVRKWLDEHPLPFPAKLVTQPNSGASVARNRGAAEVMDADVLAYLDSDDLWPRDYLARMLDAMAARPDAVAATCDRRDIDFANDTQISFTYADMTRGTTAWLVAHGCAGTPNTVFRGEVFHRLGGYDPTIRSGQDYHMMLRMSMAGPWLHVPGESVTVRHRISEKMGGAEALSHQYPDRRLNRAKMMHRFIFEEGGRERVPAPVWRRKLGALWYKAGRQMLDLGRDADAAACFERAVEVQPWSPRARWRKLLTRGAARP